MKKECPEKVPHYDLKSLNDKYTRNLFLQTLEDKIDNHIDFANSSIQVASFSEFMRQAAEEVLPIVKATARRPWISERTLRYIDERSQERAANNKVLEAQKHKLVKASVKQDRTSWLHELLASGSWQEVRKLHKPAAAKQGRLKNTEGIVINSSERADTFAKYLESVQWAVRPLATVTDAPPLFDALPVDESSIMDEEICMVLKKLHQKKAPGHDNLNPEFWKIMQTASRLYSGLQHCVTEFCFRKISQLSGTLQKLHVYIRKGIRRCQKIIVQYRCCPLAIKSLHQYC